jgi:hypothetical protein
VIICKRGNCGVIDFWVSINMPRGKKVKFEEEVEVEEIDEAQDDDERYDFKRKTSKSKDDDTVKEEFGMFHCIILSIKHVLQIQIMLREKKTIQDKTLVEDTK